MAALNTVVRVVQYIAAFAAAAFVFLLFTNEPSQPAEIPAQGADVGEAIYTTRCASCHGGDGSGGFGPALAGVVASNFPNPADQAVVIANGRGSMPSFADSLTPEEIDAVVVYTREDL
jgi:mono/diheme cytochrome c family protein